MFSWGNYTTQNHSANIVEKLCFEGVLKMKKASRPGNLEAVLKMVK